MRAKKQTTETGEDYDNTTIAGLDIGPEQLEQQKSFKHYREYWELADHPVENEKVQFFYKEQNIVQKVHRQTRQQEQNPVISARESEFEREAGMGTRRKSSRLRRDRDAHLPTPETETRRL